MPSKRVTHHRMSKPIRSVKVTAPKGVKVDVKHKKTAHNPVEISIGRKGFSFGYRKGQKKEEDRD